MRSLLHLVILLPAAAGEETQCDVASSSPSAPGQALLQRHQEVSVSVGAGAQRDMKSDIRQKRRWWVNKKSSQEGPSTNVYEFNHNKAVASWGGSCTCPDGQTYDVSDNNDGCASLQCVGGIAGKCHNEVVKDRIGMRAICGEASTNTYEFNAKRVFAGYGGTCTCPDGQTYDVSDNNDDCESLQCLGGAAGECQKEYVGARRGMRVVCGRAPTTTSTTTTGSITTTTTPAPCQTACPHDEGSCPLQAGNEWKFSDLPEYWSCLKTCCEDYDANKIMDGITCEMMVADHQVTCSDDLFDIFDGNYFDKGTLVSEICPQTCGKCCET